MFFADEMFWTREYTFRRPQSLELARRRFMKVVTEVKSGGVREGDADGVVDGRW